VHADGRGEPVMLPRDTARATQRLVVGTIAPDGLFSGRVTESYAGSAQLAVRALLSSEITETRRAQMTRAIANGVFEGASGDSLQLFDGRDLTATARVSLVVRDGRATTSSGTTDILTLPMHTVISPQLISEVAAHVPRRYHINAAYLFGVGEESTELRVTLPDGWHARLPANVEASSVFGDYSATYAQEGRELRVVRRSVGKRGVYAPDRVAELLTFLRTVARDDARYIILEHT